MHKFGVWAPKAQKMSLKWRDQILPMDGPNRRGWWTLEVPEAGAETSTRSCSMTTRRPIRIRAACVSRMVCMAPSSSTITAGFEWHDQLWRGAPKMGSIIYELHIGTFSKEGTFDGAIPHLQYLADLGVTHVEVMPVAAWAGEQGWGYDGVALFATHEPYGGPTASSALSMPATQRA